MLDNGKAFSGFAVKDVDEAASFYTDTLGMQVDKDNGLLRLKVGDGAAVLVYPKPNHVPATFTVLNFPVDNIDAAVDELTSKGIVFEQYDAPIKTDEKGRLFGSWAQRRRYFKNVFMNFPMRPFVLFVYLYIVRGGFLDGKPGLYFVVLRVYMEFLIDMTRYEAEVVSSGREP